MSKKQREKVNAAALQRVVEKFGDRAKMARALDLTRSYTAMWQEVPIAYVRRVAALTGMTPEEVLPDPYPYSEKTKS